MHASVSMAKDRTKVAKRGDLKSKHSGVRTNTRRLGKTASPAGPSPGTGSVPRSALAKPNANATGQPPSPSPSGTQQHVPKAIVPPTVTQAATGTANVVALPTEKEKATKANIRHREVKTGRKMELSVERPDKPERPEKPEPTRHEKIVVKSALRKKRSSNTSNSSDNKTSSENDKKGGVKQVSQHSSSDSRKKNEAAEKSVKKSGEMIAVDKENEEKTRLVEKQEKEKEKARIRAEDARLERMPESSQLNISARALRKHGKRKKAPPLSSDFFKPNGEPVWMMSDLPDEMCPKNETGHLMKNQDLIEGLAESGMEVDEIKWSEVAKKCCQETLTMGERPSKDFDPDPYAPLEEVEKNCVFVNMEAIQYNTARVMVDFSWTRVDAADNINALRSRMAAALSPPKANPASPATPNTTDPTVSPATPDLKADPATLSNTPPSDENNCGQIRFFDMGEFRVVYDRSHPIASIRKFHKKLARKMTKEKE